VATPDRVMAQQIVIGTSKRVTFFFRARDNLSDKATGPNITTMEGS